MTWWSSTGRRRRLLLLGLMAGMAIASPASTWAALTASTGDMTLPAVPYSHAAQETTGSITLTASDTGTCLLVCTNSGWNVTLVASGFAYSGPNSGATIPAANLAITNARPPTRVSGQEVSPAGGPRTTGVTGTLDVPRKTLQADGPSGLLELTYYGIGTYEQIIDVRLIVPGQSRVGTYTTTLTVTISAGP